MTEPQKPGPNVNDLIRGLARRDRLVVGDGATSSDVSNALLRVREDRDQGQPGSRRLVRTDKVTISDLIRQLHEAAADDDEVA